MTAREMVEIPGIGTFPAEYADDLLELPAGGEGRWQVGVDGVRRILTPRDRKVEFILFADYALAFVKSAMGSPAIYSLAPATFTPPASAVLMDLDGTTVNTEPFWVWVIEQVTARLLDNPRFTLEAADAPHISGHAVSEHLQYCLEKYCPEKTVEEARALYFEITRRELALIARGEGRQEAFQPSPGLRDFLLTLKARGVKIGLVSSGLYEKAWPSILAAFRALGLGDPLDFYDAIITAGTALLPGQAGTLGELAAKPHPWLYAETFRVGLGLEIAARSRTIGVEDSSAGVVALRLTGLAAIGLDTGNIRASGARPLLHACCHNLEEALGVILGE